MKSTIKNIFFQISVVGLFLALCSSTLLAQLPYRISAVFTIKEKRPDSTYALIKGTVYYDKLVNKIIYNVTFPEKEQWVLVDTITYKYRNGKFVGKYASAMQTEFSIFSMALKGNMADFGLPETPFKLEKVEQEKDMIISTWHLYGKSATKPISKILLSKIDKKLNGLIIFTSDDKMASKQFYENYVFVKGVWFPQKVTQYVFTKGGENLQLTSYSNILINDKANNEMYNYTITTK
jgi:hypothetical protein